jgi:hypothetical protein
MNARKRRNDDCKSVDTAGISLFALRVEAYMEIRFISSLTAEDENLFAPALLKAVGALLDQLPIAYTMRIETTGAQVFQHSHALPEPPKAEQGASFGVNAPKLAYYVSQAAPVK